MATLQQIIQREVNPFDSVTFTTGNFWTQSDRATTATVESIHQSAITQVENTLQYVIRDSRTRSILLTGDSGCGKSYLLTRLKKNLNDRAFFVYIEPCLVRGYIWQHTLRHAVDGLMHVPEGEQESQLLLWLKGLSAYNDNGILQRLLGARNHFVRELRSIYPTGIYQARDFFTVLYSLANPDLYFSACDWLRGNSVSEEELGLLGVSSTIETEEAAKGIIANFGRISTDNKPIVLCFDQVEAGVRASDGSLDLTPVFNVNTAFHNNNLKNFLIIVSIIQDKWRICQNTILRSDLARISQTIILRQIDLEQVKALWATRLSPIHAQTNPEPDSPIAPFNEQQLEERYPGGRANLRASLGFAGRLYEEYNTGYSETATIDNTTPPPSDYSAAFNLLWQNEFNNTKNTITRLRQFSSPELVEMLMTAMNVLEVENISSRLLSGTYSSYSFSYQSNNGTKVGIMWNENPNLRSFSYAMRACGRALQSDRDINLILIRSEFLGTRRNRGYQTYQQIFNNSSHQHLQSSLESVHYLRTYQKLVNDARSGDLVLNFQPLSLANLQKLVRENRVLYRCSLLQDLGIVPAIIVDKDSNSNVNPNPVPDRNLNIEITEFLFNFVRHHQFLGEQTLIRQAQTQFAEVAEAEIKEQIQKLVEEEKISFINPDARPEERLICLIPQAVAGGR